MSTTPEHLLLIFLKEPIPGKVKTRLASTMGEEDAVRVYRALVSVLITQLKWVKNTHFRFCYAPADAQDSIQHWILPQLEHRLTPDGTVTPLSADGPPVDCQPQAEGGLGERLEHAFQEGFKEGFKEVSAIGTDCPFLSDRWIHTAHLAGRNEDVVIGPTYDGGYYFISLKSFSTVPFRDIPWSTEETYSATMEALKKADLSCHLLPQLNDIDHEEDWVEALESPLGGKLKKAYEETAF